MKILVGVCGIGKGHSIRQYEICKELIKRGHEVRILTYLEGVKFFEGKQIKVYDVYVPIILYKGDKLNVLDCIKRNFFKYIPGKIRNRKIIRSLMKDNFIPDLCISDYEPVVAQIAYKFNKPLLNIDQQSKFIYMEKQEIDGYSCIEEKKRLSLFFPKYDRKYIVSFYKLPNINLGANVELVYPILANDIKKSIDCNIRNKTIVVYFSKFINVPIKQSYEQVINVFKNFKDFKFIIFSTELVENGITTHDNVEIHKNDRKQFVEELLKCDGVISTAGHTLIAESFYVKKPIFVIPLPTFDQHYCGKFILDNKLGFSDSQITYENLKFFLDNLNEFKQNIETCENLVETRDTLNYIVDEIEKFNKDGN